MTYAFILEPYTAEHEALRNDPETGPVQPEVAEHGILALRRYESGELLAWGRFVHPDGFPMLVAAGKSARAVIRLQEMLERLALRDGMRGYAVQAGTDRMKQIFSRLAGFEPVPYDQSGCWFHRKLAA